MAATPPDVTPARSSSLAGENGVAGQTSTGTPASAMPADTAARWPPGCVTPRKSPSEGPAFRSVKKLSPLKHVTPILKKYNAQRKAKSAKKPLTVALTKKKNMRRRKDSGSSCSDIDFTFESSPEKVESVSPDKGFLSSDDQHLRTPSPACACPEDEPMEENDFDAPSSPLLKDNAEDLAALMHASSNVIPGLKGKTNLAKRRKHMKEIEATLQILMQEDPAAVDQRENHIAVAYMRRVHQVLLAEGEKGEETLNLFFEALLDAEPVQNTEAGIQQLFKTVSELFKGKNELLDPFLSFLKPGEAKACGKAMEHMELANMTDFLIKAEVAFSKQPQVLKTILGHLTTLAAKPDLKEEELKSVILPLLKGHPLLKDCFLQLLPDSKPPESLMYDFEVLQFNDSAEGNDQDYEILNLPPDDSKDLAGGDNCPCPCHDNTDDEMLKSKANHCISCGTKYINGKVYMVINRQLKPARLTFLNEDMQSAIKRLSVDPAEKTRTRRQRASNSLSTVNPQVSSPPKGPESENDDSESWRVDSDCSPPKRCELVPPQEQEVAVDQKPIVQIKANIDLLSPGSSENSREMLSGQDELIVCDEESLDFMDDEESMEDEEIPEDDQDEDESSVDGGEEINIIMKQEEIEVKVKSCPGSPVEEQLPVPIKLEEEFCDEWTRNEDKIILQVIEQNSNANMIDEAKQLLPMRSECQIRKRFETLMKLLTKMSSEASGE
ncbi:Hypothetical predicted protein [Cloeon dipterum]|uniref:Myb-like domain-containing protein n=1 Tax=Cloeon dipterum TaxID=197152 RepID=A0A8S1DW17_9INSE|nr:Hypothetical predicted protein [Cloeon dipterum]